MNRDELRSRIRALAPEIESHPDGGSIVGPSEPGGGRWIALYSWGVACLLVNWYSAPQRFISNPVSRGVIVSELCRVRDPLAAARRFNNFELDRLRPFRSAAIFPETRTLMTWEWDSTALRCRTLPWANAAWISSGADEPRAQMLRQASIDRHAQRRCTGEGAFLIDLHASHEPEASADSICMHRMDAATVSFTEIEWTTGCGGTLSYWDGPPCQRGAMDMGMVRKTLVAEKSAAN